jgi:predicted Zn-dependent protease
MNYRFSRYLTAGMLALSLWMSAISVPAQQQSQPTPQTTGQQSTDKKAQSSVPAQSTGKPLPTNEDPAMIGKRNINKGLIAKMSGSMEKEVAIGRQYAAEVDRQAKFIDDPVVTEYINRVGQNLVLHSDAKVPFTIKVIDSDEVNAFALPGGFMYVNKGLILAADNEAELAGAMAHEIGHVAARHAMENQTKANLMQYGAIAATILTGGILGEVIYDTAGLWLPLSFLKFTRSAEEEADRLGVQYLYAAGYDPTAMAAMFEKLEGLSKKKPGAISKLFADHPAPPDRRAASLALVARFPEREEYIISTSEFQKVKARLLRLSNAKSTTAGNIAGSSDNNGAPGRPTLKRRDQQPDDTTGTSDSNTTPTDQKPNDPPKLKRKTDNTQNNQSSTPSNSTP